MAENKCCATCANYAEYKIKRDGRFIERCGCAYYDMTTDRANVDSNKCNCVDAEGWERESEWGEKGLKSD